jgi:hypothetical protein
MNKETLVKMEAWKISPKVSNGQKAYSQDDITLGKLIVEMGNIGLGVRDGFERDHSRCIKVAMRSIRSQFFTVIPIFHLTSLWSMR